MSALKRLEVIDKIASYMQESFSTTDINVYLGGFNIQAAEVQTSNKKTYVKQFLATQSNDLIENIADDLNIEYIGSINSRENNSARPSEDDLTEIWGQENFQLFLSHLTADKIEVGQLKESLSNYGIAAFVAHEDIHPTTEWQIEIEKALNSMDALAALLSDNFVNSKWTDQEVGWALGKGLVVIPLKKGADPYGFMGKYQALNVSGKTPEIVAKDIFDILKTNPKTKDKILKIYKNIIINNFINADNFSKANDLMDILETLDNLENNDVVKIRAALNNNSQLKGARKVQSKIHHYLERYN